MKMTAQLCNLKCHGCLSLYFVPWPGIQMLSLRIFIIAHLESFYCFQYTLLAYSYVPLHTVFEWVSRGHVFGYSENFEKKISTFYYEEAQRVNMETCLYNFFSKLKFCGTVFRYVSKIKLSPQIIIWLGS